MSDKIYYSPSMCGFFHSNIHAENEMPLDLIEVEMDQYEYLIRGQESGLEIHAGEDGAPCLSPPLLSAHDRVKSLLCDADAVIQPMLGYASAGILSDAEKERFKAWNEYRKALEGVDVTADELEWPDKPE